jgi:dimeric dUTPase (all-alpha-NTP-PPase superfamily)
MRLTKKQLEEIIETVFEHASHEIEVNGPQDYDVHNYVHGNSLNKLWVDIQSILGPDKADLQELFDLQMQFQKKVDDNNNDHHIMPWIQHVRLMFIGIITEACEALEETNWKPWKQSKTVDIRKLKEEIVDLWHFVINLTLDSGMDAEEVFRRFQAKNKINNERQEKGY